MTHSYYDETPYRAIAEDPLGNKLNGHPWNLQAILRPAKAEDWENKYSWAKSPRWDDWKKRIDGETHVLEAGPLARLWITAMAKKVAEPTGNSIKFTLPAGSVAGYRVPQELALDLLMLFSWATGQDRCTEPRY